MNILEGRGGNVFCILKVGSVKWGETKFPKVDGKTKRGGQDILEKLEGELAKDDTVIFQINKLQEK